MRNSIGKMFFEMPASCFAMPSSLGPVFAEAPFTFSVLRFYA